MPKRTYDSFNDPSQGGSESDRKAAKKTTDSQSASFNVAKHFYGVPSSLGKRKSETEGTGDQSDPRGIIEGQEVMKRLQQMSAGEMRLVHERLQEADQIRQQQELDAFYRQRKDEI